MMTVRQMERLWNTQKHRQLLDELLIARPEAPYARRLREGACALPAAAIGIIRLEELAQSHVPLYSTLQHAILSAQEVDGGWGDPMITALCTRSLETCHGTGLALQRALAQLANLQQDQGAWPAVPLRRMPADGVVTAFILSQLADSAAFRNAARFDAAVNWFETHLRQLDWESRQCWERIRLRCRPQTATPGLLRAS